MRFTGLFIFFIFFISNSAFAGFERLYGQWKGVKMFQDENSYDGKTYFLPNEGEMILDKSSIRMYYYPYFKSAEFNVSYSDKAIIYKIDNKDIICNYYFKGDTLAFEMTYIKKVFVKFFTRTTLEPLILADLDKYGFRLDKLMHEFELDTFHKDQYKGFHSIDSLGIDLPQFIKFDNEDFFTLDRTNKHAYSRTFKRINYNHNGVQSSFEIAHIGGTQAIHLKPITACECDSITIPYLTVKWADRIRKAIQDEEDF